MTAFGAGLVRAACCAVGTAVLLLAASGCGSSRDYAVPDDLCGVPVDPDVISPLLPDGDTVKQERYPSKPGAPRCQAVVDDTVVLRLTGDFTETSTDPFKAKQSTLLSAGHPAAAHGIGDRAMLADSGALAVTECAHKGKRMKYVVELNLATRTPEKTADRRKAVAKFFPAYVPAAVQRQGC